jgi:hypothetical protein
MNCDFDILLVLGVHIHIVLLSLIQVVIQLDLLIRASQLITVNPNLLDCVAFGLPDKSTELRVALPDVESAVSTNSVAL